MSGAKIAIGVLVALGLGGAVLWYVRHETPAQAQARWNLEALDAIESTWQEHDPRKRSVFLDEAPFRQCAAELRRVDTTSASDDVRAILDRYAKFCTRAPELIHEFQTPPAATPAGNKALEQRAVDNKLMDIGNLGIQLEILLRGIDDDIAKLRAQYKRQAK